MKRILREESRDSLITKQLLFEFCPNLEKKMKVA